MLFYGNPFKRKSLNYQVGNNDRPKRAVNVKVLESILREQKPLGAVEKGNQRRNENSQEIERSETIYIQISHLQEPKELNIILLMIKSSLAKCASIAGSNLLCQSIRIIRPPTRPRGGPDVGKETLIGKDTH